MKLVNAKLFQDELKRKFWEIWYDEKYQYYFGSNARSDFCISDSNNGYQTNAFAVLNDTDDLIGCISYSVESDVKVAQWFGAINFSDDKTTFGFALKQVIEDCFIKFGLEVVEFNVICGNPIEKTYDRLCKKCGGSIVGIKHKRALNMHGDVCDTKTYEILRENFMKCRGMQNEN